MYEVKDSGQKDQRWKKMGRRRGRREKEEEEEEEEEEKEEKKEEEEEHEEEEGGGNSAISVEQYVECVLCYVADSSRCVVLIVSAKKISNINRFIALHCTCA